MFSAFCLKLPKEKVENENVKQSLLMDMLNELGKCPKLLFNKLTEADKKEFQPELSSEAERNVELNSFRESMNFDEFEKEITELVSRKRSKDRFTYFALRFLDELDIFKNIRFQITLGKLLFSPNDVRKKLILDQEQPRVVTKTVRAYGKLSDFLHKEEQILSELPGNNNQWKFDQFAPHYNIENNKIPFYRTSEKKYPTLKQNNKTVNQPTGFISAHALPKLVALAVLKPKAVEATINNFFKKNDTIILNIDKLNEIKAKLDFGNDPEKLTRKIIDQSKNPNSDERKARRDYARYLKNRNAKLNEVLANYKITHSQLPGVVKDFLLNIHPPSLPKRISTFLKEEQLEIKQALKDIEKKEANNDSIKLGELATYLARDIINMIEDPELKKKLTSPYFNKIQHDIAFFGKSKNTLIELFKELGILANSKGHVFLKLPHLNDCIGVIEFYKSYLNKKKNYLKKLRENVKAVYGLEGEKAIHIKLPYKYKMLSKKYQIKTIASYLEKPTTSNKKKPTPINVPLNIFDAELFKALPTYNGKGKAGLYNLLAQHLSNDTQPFYNYKRVYKIDGEEKEVNIMGKNCKTNKRAYDKWVFKNEKEIRYEQSKDRLLKMMCIDLLKQQETDLKLDSNNLQLNNISKNEPLRNFLNSPVRFTKKITKGEYYLVAEDNTETKEKVKATIAAYKAGSIAHINNWYTWTVKDYGNFNKLVLDRRLPGLLAFFEFKQDIPIALVDYELKEYNKYWHQIFDEIIKIEKAIFEKDEEGLVALHLMDKDNRGWHPHIQFKYYLSWMREKNINFNNDLLNDGRNKFSHSQFPTYGKVNIDKIKKEKADAFNENHMKKGHKGNEYKSITMQIYKKYKTEIDDILKQIKEL